MVSNHQIYNALYPYFYFLYWHDDGKTLIETFIIIKLLHVYVHKIKTGVLKGKKIMILLSPGTFVLQSRV
jgi:hypothetical protein